MYFMHQRRTLNNLGLSPAAPEAGLPYTTNLKVNAKRSLANSIGRRVANGVTRSKLQTRRSLPGNFSTSAVPPIAPQSADDFLAKFMDLKKDVFKKMGGAQGKVYVVKTTDRTMTALKKLRASLVHTIKGDSLTAFTHRYAIKVMQLRDGYIKQWKAYRPIDRQRLWTSLVHTSVSEASIHHELANKPVLRLFQDSHDSHVSPLLNIRRHIPKFYFGGVHEGAGVYVLVMEYIEGETPRPPVLARRGPMSIARIERAILTLHAHGIAHADLHSDNILLGRDGQVTLIDLGFATHLPSRLYAKTVLDKIRRAYETLKETRQWPEDVANGIWYSANGGIGQYINTYMAKGKRVSWYNPNGKYLKTLRTGFTKDELDKARLRVWDIPAKKSPLPSLRKNKRKPKVPYN